MKSTWKSIYSGIKAAVVDLDSIDSLLRQTVRSIALAYRADCLLWTVLEATPRLYASQGWWAALEQNAIASPLGAIDSASDVRLYETQTIPAWLTQHSQLHETAEGDLLVPIPQESSGEPLRFVLQIRRAVSPGWSKPELESIEIVCSQLEMAYSALFWRDRLEQSRAQAALVGRIARLLNSSLNPDEIVERIVAELGQGLHCDRCVLIDLRHDPVSVLAVWDGDSAIEPLESRQIDRSVWQEVIEMFLQAGASFLAFDLDSEPDPLQDWLRDIQAASVLLIPLFTQSEFFGAVALLEYGQTRTYQIDELQTIRQVADQAAIALTNAQHYQSLWFKQEALRLQNNSLQQEVIRDQLTHLLNRRSLERELSQLSARAVWTVQPAFSIIVCDIDYFKLVNDTHGHPIGDQVLHSVAARLQKQLRRETQAYRYGGEEFVVILTEATLEKAIDVAERLRQAICTTPISTSVGSIRVTASFGVAQQDSLGDRTAWDVLQRADRALYLAKRAGRDRVEALGQPC
ncbi:sensor domain-containing diguanylate cyclase [Microcoleus sp. FACHB-1515]|uniref:GGDEF domain-containing protein n=1 Tax=Cyanophyceae TaxID=3028117 RepID=UPI001684EE94|nr:sensor domain-containing diguanylate cyclase [Microcoleus sp. FACHB-1515]MBD2090925.1 sensor domain-containing diguanylate cyclase [Microcoleus sp. FACHB-1515]